jgi:L-asparaginase
MIEEKKKILIITTGGTIAMRSDGEYGVVPNNELVDILHSFPQIHDIASIEVFAFSNVPSPFLIPQQIFELAKLVDTKITNYDGVVITHGTDTLEESAYMLDLLLQTDKPVIFTAAMRSESELGLDGPRNIVGAVRVASAPESSGKGVLIVMNDEIDAARDVVKTDSGKTNSFETPSYGILGIIDPDKVVFYRELKIKEKIETDKIEPNIDLIKCVPGMDSRYIDASIEKGAKAIVIEAFGRGNVPRTLVPGIERALANDTLIVLVSRTYTGRVIPEYGYTGGGMHLQKLGVILGGDLKGPKMRIKLMILFGKYKDPNRVKDYLLRTIY